MKLEEAIIYLLASSGHGMKTWQIAPDGTGMRVDYFRRFASLVVESGFFLVLWDFFLFNAAGFYYLCKKENYYGTTILSL